jgi:hypothetical protein
MSKNIRNIEARQALMVAIFEVTAANFAANGNTIDIEVEPGTILMGARIKKLEAFDGTTDTFTFGTVDTPTRYGSATTLKDTAVVTPTLDDAVLGQGTQGNASAPSAAPNPGPNY